VQPPAGKGHYPCLDSKCHGKAPTPGGTTSFFTISKQFEKNKEFADAYERAQKFCRGCHPQVPRPWDKVSMLAKPSWQNQRDHHIEMKKNDDGSGSDHYAHTLKTGCRTCHVVDDKTFELSPRTPGHQQCMTCHTATMPKPGFGMDSCANCHKPGSKKEFLEKEVKARYPDFDPAKMTATRPGTDVRACKTAGKPDAKPPCFKHETEEHRTSKGEDVQCKKCHFMINDKNQWKGRSFATIADLHFNKIIGDVAKKSDCGNQGKQHDSCAGSKCHKPVDFDLGAGRCTKCHLYRKNVDDCW
jgi:hypothetical protein